MFQNCVLLSIFKFLDPFKSRESSVRILSYAHYTRVRIPQRPVLCVLYVPSRPLSIGFMFWTQTTHTPW